MQIWYDCRGPEKWRYRMRCRGIEAWDEKGGDTGLALEIPQLPTALQWSVKEMQTQGWAHLVLGVTKRTQI